MGHFGKELTTSNTQNIVLDLNGKTVNGYTPGTIITNNITLLILGGYIVSRRYEPHKTIDNVSTATLNINGGTLYCQYLGTAGNRESHYAIYSNTTANINLNGGTIRVYNCVNGIYGYEYMYGICVEKSDTENTAIISVSGTSQIIGSGIDVLEEQ